MANLPSGDWRCNLENLRNVSLINIRGIDAVQNESEAITVIALIKALPSTENCFVYIEPYDVTRGDRGAVDICVAHELFGFFWIEVKGHSARDIEIEGSELVVNYGGERKHVWAQVKQRMWNIADHVKKLHLPKVAMNCMIAFPKIKQTEWEERGFLLSIHRPNVLLSNDLEDPKQFLQKLKDVAGRDKTELFNGKVFLELKRRYGCASVLRNDAKTRSGISTIKLGSFLDDLEGAVRAPSDELLKIARMTVKETSLLIRGVAGSGKTVALGALCSEYLDRELQDWSSNIPLKVLVLCHNHSLVSLLSERIQQFWAEFYRQSFPSQHLKIETISSATAQVAQSAFGEIVPREGTQDDSAAYVLQQLQSKNKLVPNDSKYHAVFVDEAQDFSPDELRLAVQLARPNARNERAVVVFYDDAQNINGRARPTWSHLGLEVDGNKSIVMKQCRRSSRQIVELGFNILTGRFADKKKVGTRTFADTSWLKKEGLIVEQEEYTEVKFCHFDGPPPVTEFFLNKTDMLSWVIDEIVTLITQHEVRPEHICVAFRRNQGYEFLKQELERRLKPRYILGVVHSFDDRSKRSRQILAGHVTVSSLGRLKGYEAPVVFLVGIEHFGADASDRAAFYVGTTRAKNVLYLCGVGDESVPLLKEVRDATRRLRFVGFPRSTYGPVGG